MPPRQKSRAENEEKRSRKLELKIENGGKAGKAQGRSSESPFIREVMSHEFQGTQRGFEWEASTLNSHTYLPMKSTSDALCSWPKSRIQPLPAEEKMFNAAHEAVRNDVDRAFGVLAHDLQSCNTKLFCMARAYSAR
jgi:hypothetical protein